MKQAKPVIAEKMIDYIEERILSGEYAPGSRIPSVRRFALKFKLSYGSAMRAIDYLCGVGKIEKHPKQGLFITRNPRALSPEAGRRFAFFIGTQLDADCNSLWYNALMGLSQNAANAGDSIVITPLPLDHGCNEVFAKTAREMDGMVLFNSYDWPLQEQCVHIPLAGVLFDHRIDERMTLFNIDAVDAAQTAVRYFSERNCKCVVIVSSAREIFLRRGRIFAAQWSACGGQILWKTELPEKIVPEYGYLFTSDQTCQNACEKLGGIPENMVMLSIDGKRLLRPDFHPFPTIAIDWFALGGCIYHELITRLDNPAEPVKNINLCGKLSIIK